eukprot:Tbor_TRINITY_DN2450_c0_g1::TRINITY_DN2450_c0_g1_i1::g.2590::m.2590/K00798/MMAB, pduO; cob(I)alamin adenosyltransferase
MSWGSHITSISLASYPLAASITNIRGFHTLSYVRLCAFSPHSHSSCIVQSRFISHALKQLMERKRSAVPICAVWDGPNDIEQSLSEEVLKIHSDAVKNGGQTYTDPDSGLMVFTREAHLERGSCCGGGCRHCPYNHVNVNPSKRAFIAKKYPSKSRSGESCGSETAVTPNSPLEGPEDSQRKETSSVSIRRKASVYTRTGDMGKSSLYTGERRSKSDPIFDSLGTVDELNSSIGVAKEYLRLQLGESLSKDVPLDTQTTPSLRELFDRLEHIQQLLLDTGSILATPSVGASDRALEVILQYHPEEWVEELEQHIDAMDAVLPKQTSFILPGGGLASAYLHVSRTVCRRAERAMTMLIEEEDTYDGRLGAAVKFINRLSDFLYVAARFSATEVEVPRSRR